MGKLHSLFDGSDQGLIESERRLFEADAEPYGFDLARHQCAAPEPWAEYESEATGHRWAGWLAARAMSSNTTNEPPAGSASITELG